MNIFDKLHRFSLQMFYCILYGRQSTLSEYLPISALSLAEYSLYWWHHFLPILLVITLSPTVFHLWLFTCWSWHFDNILSFVDGKETFGLSFTAAMPFCNCSLKWKMTHVYSIRWLWLDFGKLTKLSHWANSIILAQLMATLVHYTYTVPLPGLIDWSAFLERVLPTL